MTFISFSTPHHTWVRHIKSRRAAALQLTIGDSIATMEFVHALVGSRRQRHRAAAAHSVRALLARVVLCVSRCGACAPTPPRP
jgi:hypothetical protein